MLDEIAWLFNLRGNDIPYNPVFFSYAAITPTTATIYIDTNKLTPEVKNHLNKDVTIRPYEALFADLKSLSESVSMETQTNGESQVTGTTPSMTKKSKFLISTKASWALSLDLGGEESGAGNARIPDFLAFGHTSSRICAEGTTARFPIRTRL